jgi:RNA polymerase sigma-70 factor (sigma-E family)
VRVESFEEFFEVHYGPVLRLMRGVARDGDEAEDVTQEAFVRACQRWRTVGRMDRPVAWVYVVALNEQRRRWRLLRRDRSVPGDEADVPDHGPGVLTAGWLADALGTLTPRQRAAVLLRHSADLPIADIAQALGCAEGTVKATLHQALRRLRIELEADDAT